MVTARLSVNCRPFTIPPSRLDGLNAEYLHTRRSWLVIERLFACLDQLRWFDIRISKAQDEQRGVGLSNSFDERLLLIRAEGEAKESNFRPLRSHQEDSTSDAVYAEGLIAGILEDGGSSNLKVVIARNEKYGALHIERLSRRSTISVHRRRSGRTTVASSEERSSHGVRQGC